MMKIGKMMITLLTGMVLSMCMNVMPVYAGEEKTEEASIVLDGLSEEDIANMIEQGILDEDVRPEGVGESIVVDWEDVLPKQPEDEPLGDNSSVEDPSAENPLVENQQTAETPEYVEQEADKEEPIAYDPLTPDGNMNLVDDYGEPTGAGKQFITMTTKAGNYFYLIIDRDDNGMETVHFLSAVSEADLLSLMDEAEVEQYEEQKAEEEAKKDVTVDEEPKEPVQEEPPATDTKKKSMSTASIVGTVAILVIIGGVFIAMKVVEKKKKGGGRRPDPDDDYMVEEDEDFLSQLPEEDAEETVGSEDMEAGEE